jgi:hypothetical protein
MNIGQLATAHIRNGGTAKASSWRAYQHDTVREIFHYATLMATVEGKTLTKVSEGWGSVTDKCGWRKLSNAALKAGFTVNDLQKS